MARYKLHGPWSIDEVVRFNNIPIVTMVADLIDTRTGHVFKEGAWQVRRSGKVVKTFKGETAWSDARRLSSDLQWEINRDLAEAGS